MKKYLLSIPCIIALCSMMPASAIVDNGVLTQNDIEWCHEVYQQYEVLGLNWFLKNYHYSIEARVCANLYEDVLWQYDGEDRIQKLIDRSRHYVELEIQESAEEAQSGTIDPTPAGIPAKFTSITKTTPDGEIFVILESTDAIAGKYMQFKISFQDDKQKLVRHVNYDLKATQDDQEVLVLESQHAQNGIAEHTTRPLSSDKPVVIDVIILGIGLPKDRETWTGHVEEAITFTVPEFGSMLVFVFVILACFIILLNSRKNFILKT